MKTAAPAVQFARALTGSQMWAVIAAGVVYHEINCVEGQLLSEAVDRAMLRHPACRVAVYAATLVTAAHLVNWLPAKVDPYAGLGRIRNTNRKAIH